MLQKLLEIVSDRYVILSAIGILAAVIILSLAFSIEFLNYVPGLNTKTTRDNIVGNIPEKEHDIYTNSSVAIPSTRVETKIHDSLGFNPTHYSSLPSYLDMVNSIQTPNAKLPVVTEITI